MTKDLETIVRDKLATGYDPVTLEVRAKAINEENVEVSIEGKSYSIKGDSVSLIGGRPEVASDTADGSGTSGNLESTDNGLDLNQGSAVNPNDTNGNHIDDLFEKRVQAVLEGTGAAELQPSDSARNGATIFVAVDQNGQPIAQGTLAELEELIASNQEAAGSGSESTAA